MKGRKHREPPPEQLFAVRIGRLPPKIKDEDVKKEFEAFGTIAHYSRPMDLSKRLPSSYAFIKYRDQQSANDAVTALNGMWIWDTELHVDEATQPCYFSNNTGGLINHEYDFPARGEEDFDSSLPPDHYLVKRQEALKHSDRVFTVKIEDLHHEMTKEMLVDIFSNFGEIANIYYPMNLEHFCRPMGIAFVRYTSQQAAETAVREMHGANLGVGRDLIVTLSQPRAYFSQDETFYNPRKWPTVKKGGDNNQRQQLQENGGFDMDMFR